MLFIRRYLLHILPPKVKSIRYSGLYSSASRKKLKIAKEILPDNLKTESIKEEISSEELPSSEILAPYKYCPVCRKRMELVEKVLPFAVPHLIYIKFGKDPPIEELFSHMAA